MYLAILSFLLWLPLVATITTPCSITWESGYRQDKFTWYVNGEEGNKIYKESYPSLCFWDNRATLQKVYRDLYFQLEGSFACIGKGNMEQSFEFQDIKDFIYPTNSYGYSSSFSFGYLVELTPDRHYGVSILPYASYSLFGLCLTRGEADPTFLQVTSDTSDSFFLTPSLKENLDIKWYGPAIGLQLWLDLVPCLRFVFLYSYNFLHLHTNFSWQEEQTFDQQSINSSFSGSLSCSGNLGQQGMMKAIWQISNCFFMTISARILYLSSEVHTVQLQEESQGTLRNLEARYKERETALEFYLGLTKLF